MERLQRDYQHPDRVYRQVQSNWSFPALNLQPVYVYWHCVLNSGKDQLLDKVVTNLGAIENVLELKNLSVKYSNYVVEVLLTLKVVVNFILTVHITCSYQ